MILAQGVFDIVHTGHLKYLRLCKQKSDILFVGVDCDEGVRQNKGSHRPYNTLKDRLDMLSEFQSIDYVFPLDDANSYHDIDAYIKRLSLLKPTKLAVSAHDILLKNKKISAKKAGIEILIIHDPLVNSTTRLAQKIGLE